MWRVFYCKQSKRGRPHEDQRLFCRKTKQVADWYTQDTSDIPLHCKVTDKVLDMIVTLSDPREASLAVVDENNQVVGIVTGRDIVLYMGTHRVIDRKPYRRCRNDGKSKTGTPEMLCIDALKIMIEGRFRNLPIEVDGKFVGILSILAAAKGRLMETMAKNTEAYESLKSLSDGMPEIDIENTTQDAFKLVSDSKAPFVSVKENNEIVDFLMDYDLRRLWLKKQ
jgi:CBS domain-containing protein